MNELLENQFASQSNCTIYPQVAIAFDFIHLERKLKSTQFMQSIRDIVTTTAKGSKQPFTQLCRDTFCGPLEPDCAISELRIFDCKTYQARN